MKSVKLFLGGRGLWVRNRGRIVEMPVARHWQARQLRSRLLSSLLALCHYLRHARPGSSQFLLTPLLVLEVYI
jgi:hypothetical protein